MQGMTTPLLANVVTGSPARNHDFDFARRALLDALYAAGGIRTDVHGSYDDGAALQAGDLLVSYTSQVPAGPAQCAALRRYLQGGGRWFALHGSASVAGNEELAGILGSRFVAHPPYLRYQVTVPEPGDPLLAGLGPAFEVEDELYILEPRADFDVLLEARWGGEAFGRTFPEAPRPLMYRRRVGDGGVLYLALGHCNRPFDVPWPGMPDAPDRRGPWALPVFRELIARGIDWAARRRPL